MSLAAHIILIFRLSSELKGTDPFLGGDFFLWTDPAEINTEYVKLK